MNRIIILFIIFLYACNKGGPVIKTNLGYVTKISSKKDTVLNFFIYNVGDEDLIIYDYSTSCNCNIEGLGKNVKINANDSIKTKIIINKAFASISSKDILMTIKTNTDTIFRNYHLVFVK